MLKSRLREFMGEPSRRGRGAVKHLHAYGTRLVDGGRMSRALNGRLPQGYAWTTGIVQMFVSAAGMVRPV